MIFALLPYYNEDSPDFSISLLQQNIPFSLIRRDRKKDGIYWTKAMNDFLKELLRYRGIKDTDVVCILNNYIKLSDNLFEIGSKVKQGEIFIPKTIQNGVVIEQGLCIDWSSWAKLEAIIFFFKPRLCKELFYPPKSVLVLT